MTTSEAKKISIISYLENLSINFKKQNNQDFWYLSPLHLEKTPSFKVDASKNLWYDHAQGKGGNILDLVMTLNNCDVSGALKILGGVDSSSFSFSPAVPLPATAKKEDNFIVVAVKTLSNPALLSYLESRKINIEIAKKFSAEIFFRKKNNDKNLFAISFMNDKGGYETRNALYKGNIGGKAITTIKGIGNGKVAVFEGFMDFLSILTKYNTDKITDDVIVLNSLSMIGDTKETLQGYKEVKYFLDNDKAGKEATVDLLATVGGTDYSHLYANYKDANDWVMDIKI
jgi:DNA primase